ncbi:bath-42 [Symbiodinium sp. CCMP2592]|nr:bath-42 [Symbiodinium sp. CCMP2592]
MSDATATAEQVSDVVLHFGVDSMPANSALLRLASPVFNRMFTSGMKEAQLGSIEVDVASKEDFITFYNLLGPWAWSTDKVKEENVDSLLAISDYYQVEIIKQTCENLLLGLPSTGTRLLQAKKHGLHRQYHRCVGDVAKWSTREDLEVLRQSEPDILLDVALGKQDLLIQFMGMKDEIVRCDALVDETGRRLGRHIMASDSLQELKVAINMMLSLIKNMEIRRKASPPKVCPPQVQAPEAHPLQLLQAVVQMLCGSSPRGC